MAETKKPTNKERLQEITAGIEQGIKEMFESDRYMKYLRTMSRFHHYSVNNQVLIHMQMPGATRVAGFNKWKNEFERHVKKGERGIKIIAPTPFKKKIEEMKLDPDTRLPVLDREGKTVMEEKEVEIPTFRPVTVFDVSQTEGKPLPQLAADLHGDVKHYEIFMEALRRSSPVPMGFENMQGMDGYFSPEQQRVAICEGMSEVQTVCAAVHEITHAKLHNYEKARLEAARGNETREPPKPKDSATEEVEAESVSYAVCQYYGIDTGANSFGYIASWSSGKELPELRASLETISKTASSLITDIDRHFRDICKERGIDLTEPEQAAPEADTPERFAADFYDYMSGLHNAGLMDHPFSLDPREQTVRDLANEYHRGQFLDTHGWLEDAARLTGTPTAGDLLERLSKLEQARDAALAFKMEANPRATGTGDSHFVQAYERTEDPSRLIPREVVYVGSPEECRGLLAQLEEGSITAGNVRDYEREKAGQVPLTDKEAVYLLDNHMYLYIQTSENGYDYTLYEKQGLREYDGGQLDRPDFSIDEARAEIVAFHELTLEYARVPIAIMDVIDPPPKLPGAEAPQGPPYDTSAYTDRQWEEIKAGWASGVDTSLYSDPALNAMQMHMIREGLEKGWPASLYAKPGLSWEQMDQVGKLMAQGYDVTAVMVGGSPVDFTDPSLSPTDTEWLLRQMEYDAIPKMLYSPEQWAEIRQGMEDGLDVKQYADPSLPAEDMKRLRDALERGLVIQPVPQPESSVKVQGADPEQAGTSAMLPDAPEQALDEYPMPDPVLTVHDLENCGYLDGDLLPLSKERALELYEKELTVYAVLDGGEASMAFDREDIEDHGGMFAVPREEWGTSEEFIKRLDDRQNHQQERENAFLCHKGDCFAIYQLHDGDDLHYVRYEPLDRLRADGGEVLKENYNLIYTAPLTVEGDTETCLHQINHQFNLEHPEDFRGRSLSTSDIVAIKRDGEVSCHYVDSSFGFTMLPDFLKPENYLKNAEMALEDDYGMIDGIINNGPKQPTVADLEAQVRAGGQISLLDLANAAHREQGEKKKSVMERLKEQPSQADRKKTAPRRSAEREI